MSHASPAVIEPTPRRQWRFVDPVRPGDRLVCAALAAYRVAIRQGRYTVHHERGGVEHLGKRLDERGIDLADVLRAVAVGRICAFPHRADDREWIGGGYLLDDVMVYVQAPARRRPGLDFYDLIPSICSAWRVGRIASQPLTVTLSEFASLRRAAGNPF